LILSGLCPVASGQAKKEHGENSMALSETQAMPGQFGYADASPIPLSLADKAGANGIVRELARRRAQVVVPLFLCSFAMYVATLVALSYFPGLVGYKIFGSINLAYALALAQFAITFLTAFIYAVWTRRAIDPLVAEAFTILERAPVTGGIR
jgi:uncharacterized membrane protein (DUF485 family)